MKRYLYLFWLFLRVVWLEQKRRFWEWQSARRTARIYRALARKRRPWFAHSPYGVVELGNLNHREALAQASRLGHVTYVDVAYARVFYDTHKGGPAVSEEGT